MELLVVIGIIALLAAILLPVLAQATHAARRANCSNKQRQIYQGVRLYLNNFDEFFPLAWLETGQDARLGQLTYWRTILQEACETGFTRHLRPQAEVPGDWDEYLRDYHDRNKQFWRDPAKGWTNDYFAPSLVFKGWLTDDKEIDTSKTDDYDKHPTYSQLTMNCPSTQRPMLTEVDASFGLAGEDADEWKDKTGGDNEHKTDLENGWTLVDLTNPNITGLFIGVGLSLRDEDDYNEKSVRFDFRHNRAVNVLFLDGHVDSVNISNTARLQRIYERWDRLIPREEEM